MLNTKHGSAESSYVDQLRELESLAEEAVTITRHLQQSAIVEDWSAFTESLKHRQSCFRQIEEIYLKTNGEDSDPDHKRSDQNQDQISLIKQYLKKVTKVDEEVFDIIIEKRKRLKRDIVNVNKGLQFLKAYAKQVNGKRILSRKY